MSKTYFPNFPLGCFTLPIFITLISPSVILVTEFDCQNMWFIEGH